MTTARWVPPVRKARKATRVRWVLPVRRAPKATPARWVLPARQALPAGLGWDRLTLIRKATGRSPRSLAEQHALDTTGIRLLAFGG